MFGFLFVLLFDLCFCANETPQDRFGIFRPGDFFDPFTENGLAESQRSATVVPQPNLIFGEPATIFGQFRHFARPRFRTVAQISGNQDQFNAQLWQPNSFFAELEKIQNLSPATFQYRAPTKESPVSATQQNNIVAPNAQYRVPNNEGSAQQLKCSKQPTRTSGKVNNLNVLQPLASNRQNIIGQASKLQAQSTELHAHPSSHSESKTEGGGKKHDADYYKDRGDHEELTYKKGHHHSRSEHEKHGEHDNKGHHEEKGGKTEKHHDEGAHYKKHHEGKKSHKAAKFGEKKGHKRGHKTKGYHNKFHRDEYHREHRFYDDYHKEGYHKKHGNAHSKYKKKEGGYKKGGSHKSGGDKKKHGKKGHSKKGKIVEDHKGFGKGSGKKKYHKHHKDYHKKEGGSEGKQYGYHHKQ